MKIFWSDLIDSTYLEAGRKSPGFDEGEYLFLAKGQTAGKGQGTHSFESPYGNGVYATLLIKGGVVAGLDPLFSFCVTPMAAVCVTGAVKEKVPLDQESHLGIKWVNDLLLNGQKYGGILSSVRVRDGRLCELRIGFGVNLGSAPLPYGAVSLNADDRTEPEMLAAAAADHIREFLSAPDEKKLYAEYRELCSTPGRGVLMADGSWGTAECVNRDFSLTVRLNGGRREIIRSTAGIVIM